jgi:hypothetical protein
VKTPSQDDLLGYVLGALDATQHQQIQEQIDRDPHLEEKLLEIKASIMPLELLNEGAGCRPGLARRTCEAIAALQHELASKMDMPSGSGAGAANFMPAGDLTSKGTMLPPCTMRDCREPLPSSPGSWSRSDLLVTIAVCGILASLLFPAVSHMKYRSRITGCQSNLQTLGVAFLEYSNIHDGRFVPIPTDGKLSAVGSFAPMLKAAHLVDDDRTFICPGVERDVPLVIPTLEQIERTQCHQRLKQIHRTMGGDYGYSLGYYEGGRYVSPRNLGRSYFVICADKPSCCLPDRRSANHAQNGQNCLFEDGHFEFVRGHAFGEDAIYENDCSMVAPGIDSEDTVIGPSHVSPTPFVSPRTTE